MRGLLLSLTLIAVGYLQAGCTGNTATQPQEIIFPDQDVSYQAHTDPFLTLACGQCHGTSNAAGDIVLTTYNGLLFSRPNLVVPGKADESLLNQVLEQVIGHPVGNISVISENQVQGVRTWVEEGAGNN